MAIYRVAKESGGEYYVEECNPSEWEEEPEVEGDWVYVSTRTLWSTGMFGQIESLGWIERAKLTPLNPKRKKDREILATIAKVGNRGGMKHYWWREGNKIKVQNMVGPYAGQLHEHTEEEFREWSKDIPEDRLIENKKAC